MEGPSRFVIFHIFLVQTEEVHHINLPCVAELSLSYGKIYEKIARLGGTPHVQSHFRLQYKSELIPAGSVMYGRRNPLPTQLSKNARRHCGAL
jgi:hypothetical protein